MGDSGKDYSTREASKPQIPGGVSTYRNNLLFTGVDDADLLVLAGGAQQAAIGAPADTKDNVRVHVLQVDHGLSRAHIPNDDLVVAPLNGHTQHSLTTHTSESAVILSLLRHTKQLDGRRSARYNWSDLEFSCARWTNGRR